VPPPDLTSYSQNGEDVVLWRALGRLARGRYIDVGAHDPSIDSVTMAFYERGWSGITVEPDPHCAERQRQVRPRDRQIVALAGARDGEILPFFVVEGTGLSTTDPALADAHRRAGHPVSEVEMATRSVTSLVEEAGWTGEDIHFMSVDTEGSERAVLEGVDFERVRPWVLVIEATEPNSPQSTRARWEHLVLGGRYVFCLFDGLSCFYVAEERAAELRDLLSYPACPLDSYRSRALRDSTQRAERAEAEVAELRLVVARWRSQAGARWAAAAVRAAELADLRDELETMSSKYHELAGMHHDLHVVMTGLRHELDELHLSTSWRVTSPLRSASETLRRVRDRG